jgi:hypothetical protein
MLKTAASLSSICFLLILSCKQHKVNPPHVSQTVDTTATVQVDDEDEFYDSSDYQNSAFKLIANYPTITDTTAFIKELRANCHIWTRNSQRPSAAINYFRRTKIHGSTSPVYIIEYDYHDGSSAEFPWKKQYIFNKDGKLLSILRAMRIDIVHIFPKGNPFLIAVSSTAKGNGRHGVYCIQKDSLQQVFDGFIGNRPQTYDCSEDNAINVPNEFPYTFSDMNGDGYNDIVFAGKIKYAKIDLGLNEKTTAAKFIFLYHKKNGHFIEKEDYSRKYAFIYGNTK